MERHQDLYIEGTGLKVIEDLSAAVSGEWSRNEAGDIDTSGPFCFELNNSARLFIALHVNGVEVCNIVPSKKSQLTIKEYNSILNKFLDDVVKKSRMSGMRYRITEEEYSLVDIIGEESADKFKRFSILANKSTGRSHPLDQKRWFEFIYSLVVNDKNINTVELEYFLTEDGWNEKDAFDLIVDFEYAYGAMKFALEGEK